MRLLCVTAGVVLFTEIVIFVPSLARERRIWLDRRVTEAEIAALSTAAAPDGLVDAATRDELLLLSGTETIRLEVPGRSRLVLPPAAPVRPDAALDLRGETMLDGASRALTALLRSNDRLLLVEAHSPVRPEATLTVVLHEHELDRALRAYAVDTGLTSLLEAAVVGILVYAVVHLLLVRPMRRITRSIAAFRADPERSAPLDPETVSPLPDDEIALASRELAAMQRELRAALWRNARLAALGTAVAKVSHDLRGILSPALLTAERLQMNSEPAIKRAGDVLVRSVDRATELVSKTLEFAREGPAPPARTRTTLRPLVDEAAEQARAKLPSLAVANDVAATVQIDADPEQIVRVLVNLVRNAGEANARHVRIGASATATEVAVTVTDDGPGLPDAVKEKLFRPFITGGRRGSTGLGLAIARDLIRAHGGEIVLAETGPAGTTFQLSLPTPGAKARRPAAAAGAEPPAKPADGSEAQTTRPDP
jgi:signal transduction histidine kinase